MAFTLTSTAFKHNGMIPAKYTCDAEQPVSPPLTIAGAPEGTKSFALIMDDPDIPQFAKEKLGIDVFDHWTLYNIPPETQEIPESATVGETGLNSAGVAAYASPCPPPQYEPREHRYIFKLYALSGELHFDAPPTKQQVLSVLAPLQLAETELIGRYSRA